MQKASMQGIQLNFTTRVEKSLNLQLGEHCVEKVKDIFIHISPQALDAVKANTEQEIKSQSYFINIMLFKLVLF